MQKILYPEREKWTRILERPENKGEDLDKVCKAVFDEVRRDGDEALRKYTWYFDRVRLGRFEVTEEEFQEADRLVDAGRRFGLPRGISRSFTRYRFPESVNT